MPNTLGVPYVAGLQAGGTFPLIDPRELRQNRGRFLRDDLPGLRLANALYTQSGKYASRAFCLLRRQDLQTLSATSGPRPSATGLYAGNFQLEFDECMPQGTKLTFKGMSVVHAQCCTRGVESDPQAAYLVELVDARGVLRNRWFHRPTTAQFNLLAPAYPGQYYEASLDITFVDLPGAPGGLQNGVLVPPGKAIQRIPWTWGRMIQNLWDSCGNLGAFPGMPVNPDGSLFTPAGTPQGWGFVGVPVLDALQRILEHLGLTIAADLTAGQHYTIVNNGAEDTDFDDLTDEFSDQLEDDLEFVQPGSGRVPGSVAVLFHRRNREYGTEETIRPDFFQWVSGSFYGVDVTAAQAFAGTLTPLAFQTLGGTVLPTGTHFIWDDFTVRADVDGAPVPADVTTATAIARERARQFYNASYSGTLGSMQRRYAGLIGFATGSNVDGVCWREDYNSGRLGWTTTVVRRDDCVWPELEGV